MVIIDAVMLKFPKLFKHWVDKDPMLYMLVHGTSGQSESDIPEQLITILKGSSPFVVYMFINTMGLDGKFPILEPSLKMDPSIWDLYLPEIRSLKDLRAGEKFLIKVFDPKTDKNIHIKDLKGNKKYLVINEGMEVSVDNPLLVMGADLKKFLDAYGKEFVSLSLETYGEVIKVPDPSAMSFVDYNMNTYEREIMYNGQVHKIDRHQLADLNWNRKNPEAQEDPPSQ